MFLIVRTRKSWPRYTIHDEDKELIGEKGNDRYRSRRIEQWDKIDIKIPKPSKNELQRVTYSS